MMEVTLRNETREAVADEFGMYHDFLLNFLFFVLFGYLCSLTLAYVKEAP